MANYRTAAHKFQSLMGRDRQDQKWQVYWQSLKHSIPGTQQQKQATLRKRVLKFFKGFNLELNSYYNQRRDINYQPSDTYTFCSNILMLYGIDYLPSQKIMAYFQPYECDIQMLDYSHCLVKFTGGPQALLESLYVHLVEKMDNIQDFAGFLADNEKELITWRQIRGYQELCFQRELWARLATVQEMNNFSSGCQRKELQIYQAAKAEFLAKMDKSNKNKPANNRTFNKPQPEKEAKCSCQQKLTKLIAMLGNQKCFKQTNAPKGPMRKRREPSRQRQQQRSRSRDNRHRRRQRYDTNLKGLDNVSPLKIIKEITQSHQQDCQSYKKERRQKSPPQFFQKSTHESSFISAIASQEEQPRDDLYEEMLANMQKYCTFSSSKEQSPANVSMLSKRSNYSYSVYECESGEDEE